MSLKPRKSSAAASKHNSRPGRERTAPLLLAVLLACAVVLLCQVVLAQRYKPTADPDSQEGQFLELIELQSDAAMKLTLLEQFTQRFPAHAATSWAYEQLMDAATQAGQWDKALAFGSKIVELNPDDIETAQSNVKAAEAKGDRAAVKLWSDNVAQLVQRMLMSPPPKNPEQLERWNKRMAIASQYAAQGDYALYKKAFDSGDPRQQVKLLDELLQRSPDTTYLPQALVIYLNAYRAIGDNRNALITAEKILRSGQQNEDALLLCAQAYLQRGSSQDLVLSYSAKLIDLMSKRPKPQGVRQEDWDKKKAIYSGSAHWMMGSVYITKNSFSQADVSLRAALPFLRDSGQPTDAVLFYIGWSNYKLENWLEAARFFKQCLAFSGQYREQAERNLGIIRTEHDVKE